MSHLEENARLSHELEEARDTIEAMASQVRELRQEFDLVVAQNLELRAEVKRLIRLLDELGKNSDSEIR